MNTEEKFFSSVPICGSKIILTLGVEKLVSAVVVSFRDEDLRRAV
jgi:hypothetical protein